MDGTVVSRTFLAWGPGGSAFVAGFDDERRSRISSILSASATQNLTIMWLPDESVADADADILSHVVLGYAQGSLPANTIVRIRAAYPVGPAGSMNLTDDSVEPQHIKANNTPSASLRNLRRVDDENFQWVADPSGGSGTFTSLASGGKNTIDVTDDGSGNFTIDVGQDEITATELAAGSVQRQHLHLETGITDGQALGYDSSTQRIQGLDIPDVSDYAALAGADFTGAVSIASSTTDSALTVTQSGQRRRGCHQPVSEGRTPSRSTRPEGRKA